MIVLVVFAAFLVAVILQQGRRQLVHPVLLSRSVTCGGWLWFVVACIGVGADFGSPPSHGPYLAVLAGGGLVIAVGMGYVRGFAMRVWMIGDRAWKQGTRWSALGWIATVGLQVGFALALSSVSGAGPTDGGLGSLPLMLGIGALVQSAVLRWRGDRAGDRTGAFVEAGDTDRLVEVPRKGRRARNYRQRVWRESLRRFRVNAEPKPADATGVVFMVAMVLLCLLVLWLCWAIGTPAEDQVILRAFAFAWPLTVVVSVAWLYLTRPRDVFPPRKGRARLVRLGKTVVFVAGNLMFVAPLFVQLHLPVLGGVVPGVMCGILSFLVVMFAVEARTGALLVSDKIS